MLTRLIDRFETDDTRNRGVLVPLLRFSNRARPRRRSRPRSLGSGTLINANKCVSPVHA
jgi:hypothetical protein